MIKQEWIDNCKQNADNLRVLIGKYHPSLRSRRDRLTEPELPITAPGAQAHTDMICEGIKNQVKADPITTFNEALEKGDVKAIYHVLEQAWFGVPESTSCWGLPGFAQAVDLMDDLPDEVNV